MRNYKILVDKINKLSFLDDNLLSIMKNRNINNTNKSKVHDNSVKIINKKLSNFFSQKMIIQIVYIGVILFINMTLTNI